jgi:predicted nucleic acid-binding protein
MTVLIDTNVVLDLLIRRKPHYENAARISVLSEKGYISSYISAAAVTDIYYIAKKELNDKEVVVGLLEKLLKTTHIADVSEASIHEALGLKWNDFEDSVQYITGKSISAEYIITRDPKDFADSQIDVISPEAFLDQITSS